MNSYFQEYATVAVLLAVGIIFMLALTTIASILRPNNPSKEKLTTYESGVDPVGTGWSQTYVRYYIFGLLFVIFDVEAVFIFPWAINLEKLGYFGLVEMLVFIFILLHKSSKFIILKFMKKKVSQKTGTEFILPQINKNLRKLLF